MLQVINLIVNLILFVEVVYLFTCGQRYMRVNVIRNRRNFTWERIGYILLAMASAANAVLGKVQDYLPILSILAIAFLLARKCASVRRKNMRLH